MNPVTSYSARRILVTAFKRKQKERPGFSKRMLARDLGVSPAFVTYLFKGQKQLPKERIKRVCDLLELDVNERLSLMKSVLLEPANIHYIPYVKRSRGKPRGNVVLRNQSLLSQWFFVALMEGLSLEAPLNDVDSLRERIGLTRDQLELAIRTLTDEDLVQSDGKRLMKKEKHIYIPTGRSKGEMREFHRQMIDRAQLELAKKTSSEDFERRVITGFTMSLNVENLEALKGKIFDFLDELSQEAGNGPCTEVYQCNVQFFPLTKPSEREV